MIATRYSGLFITFLQLAVTIKQVVAASQIKTINSDLLGTIN